DLDGRDDLAHGPGTRVVSSGSVPAATRSTFGDVERDTRQRAPHLAREVRIVVRDLLEGGPKGADDVEDDVVDLEHAYLHRPVARGDAPHQARAGAVQAPSEARTARAARGCGLDGV